MASILEAFNYAQLFFLLVTVFFGLTIVYMVITGKYLDLKQQLHGIPDQTGLFTFKKRLGLMYFISSVVTTWMFWNVTKTYVFGSEPGHFFHDIEDFLFIPKVENSGVDATGAFIAVAAWLVSRVYRYHIAVNVSVYSRRQTFTVLEAAGLYVNVIVASLSLLAEAPPLVEQPGIFSLSELHLMHILGLLSFVVANKLYGDIHRALTKLRRNRFGHITTTDYKQPKGSWFDVVTCPHYFAEVVSYVGIGIILGSGALTWWILTVLVFVMNLARAICTHRFYCIKFEDYPKDRRMLIPYLL